ncbi:MAG: DNA recombination protein RmuC [Ignavibacteria bacterium]|nr:DNA recombination protein RmuC [Ignavibacteria bacterium]
MTELILIIVTAILLVAVALLVVLLTRGSKGADVISLRTHLGALNESAERMERALRGEIAKNREESSVSAKLSREEMNTSLTSFAESFRAQMMDIATLQKNQMDIFANQLGSLTQTNEQKLERIRETVEARLKTLQDDNSQKLEQMRATVDEKLHVTLEQRLGHSFKIVSERLEQVHRGLGEMQTLASGVGDLKKVLSNVKTRGMWGEIQLGNLLEQILAPDQFAKNVPTKLGSNERVDFAVRLPGRDRENGVPLWLPIDAKFPQDYYQKLVEAQEQDNSAIVEEAGRQLETRIKEGAKSIKEKYLDPPRTTDFGIMFLPTEGLYAEVLRRPGLFEKLQREFRVTITGPTTLAALLNSLQMGFQTLAIEKRSSEVWRLLGEVKTEFSRFGEVLDKTHKKLQEASNTIETAAAKSRTIERKLKDVQSLPSQGALDLLGPADEPTAEQKTPDE